MSSTLVVELLLGLVTVVLGYNTFRSATQANREQSHAAVVAVDAAAYARARDIYESALDTLRAELVSTRDEIHSLRQSNDQLRAEIAPLRRSNERLQSEITLLRAEIVKLTDAENRRDHG